MSIIQEVIVCLAIIFGYYYYFKRILFSWCPRIADRIRLNGLLNQQSATGVVEIHLAAISHVGLVFLLLYSLPLQATPQLIHLNNQSLLIKGAVLGVGCMAFSALLCQLYIEIVQKIKAQGNLSQWLTMSRGGWLRHHLQLLDSVPFFLALLVISIQVGCEEYVFRGILINFLSNHGWLYALVLSSFFFVIMQAFHTPTLLTASFPMIGALVMGLVFGYLYLHAHFILPLIVAHIVYFFVAIL